jgi:hypothetical protein
MKDENTYVKEYSPRIYLPRSSLKPIGVSLTLNLDPNYHILDEIKSSLEDKIQNKKIFKRSFP